MLGFILQLFLLIMTVRAVKFTPEVLLSAPRRSSGVPNGDGSKVLYSVSTYSFADKKRTAEVRVFDTAKNESNLITDAAGAGDFNWIDDQVLMLTPGDKGATDVVIGSVDDFNGTKYTAGSIDGSASAVKLVLLEPGKYGFALTALAKPDGSVYNEETAPKPRTTGRLYSTIFVRHWNTWITPNRNAIWFGALSKGSGNSTNSTSSGSYKLSTLTNLLKSTGLESPIPPFGSTDNFDIGKSGIAFVAKDPKLQLATHTKQNLYYAPLDYSSSSAPVLQQAIITGFEGATSNPAFSPDGKSLAFTSMRQDGYESDKNHLFVIPDVARVNWITRFFTSEDGEGTWDSSPGAISWSKDGQTLYMLVEDNARVGVYSTPSVVTQVTGLPTEVFQDGATSDIHVLDTGDIFVSGTSFIDNSIWRLVPANGTTGSAKVVSSNSKGGSAFGLSRDQISEIHFLGAEKVNQAWVIKPSNFNPDEKYPLAFYVHGGPQGATADAWSTRWNMAVFAEQGYVVVAFNPTGSSGFGQASQDAIQTQWGGLPYQDLVKGWEYIETNLSYIDTSRAVSLGASYGGYMMNWIQGQPLGRKFKALAAHDGVFSMAGQMASEELWFPEHEFGGKFWNNTESWLRWDPARFTDNWATPQLVIHSEKDYRLTVSEGLAAFNVLQDKGIDSQFLSFPDENHWVLNPENSLLWHTIVFDWINGHVGLPLYGTSGVPAELKKQADQEAHVTSDAGNVVEARGKVPIRPIRNPWS